MNSIILVAAGTGTRMKASTNKLLLSFRGHPLIWYTLKSIFSSQKADELVLVTRRSERPIFEKIVEGMSHAMVVSYTDGGDSRAESVVAGINALNANSHKVLIHDGARPLVPGEAFDALFSILSDTCPAAIYAIPLVDTVKKGNSGQIIETVDRSQLWRAQTPQGILTELYREALPRMEEMKNITDDASLWEYLGIPVHMVEGKESYFKVTTKEDGERLTSMTTSCECPIRIGQGYDIHPVKEERPLYLGGVKLADRRGLLGNSDADSLIHAIIDALLGAAGLHDIGHLFPETDAQYKDISSVILLEKITMILTEKGYVIGNIDSTIVAEAPKLAPYIDNMREKIARALNIEIEKVNIKATTNERLGAIGRQEGIAAFAIALLYRRS